MEIRTGSDINGILVQKYCIDNPPPNTLKIESYEVWIGHGKTSVDTAFSGYWVAHQGIDSIVDVFQERNIFLCSESSPDCYCGVAGRSTKIVGGRETGVGEYPWQVGFNYIHSREPNYCGGSLINNLWILSAAHCFDGVQDARTRYPASWVVYLGEHDYQDNTETDRIVAYIELIRNHPHYYHRTTNYDFSLIKMRTPIDFLSNPHIRPICLPTSDENNYENYNAVVTGWGATAGGIPARKLQEAAVMVISNTECKRAYRDLYPHHLNDQNLCARAPGRDSCQGDSGMSGYLSELSLQILFTTGGPLITAGHGSGRVPGENYELIGVVSWGEGCADQRYPGVYARVTQQIGWIRENTDVGTKSCPRK